MLAEGHGHELYDADLQRQYQARDAGRVGTLYIHPPFETVFYVGVAWLPLRSAYLLWSALNLIFLAVGARRLAKEALLPWDWSVVLAASLTFVPLLLCLLQGQDSVLLLLLVILAFTALRRERAFAGGCWLALGLFKFQIVLPLVLVLLLTQSKNARNTLAKGFGLVALALAGLSAAISGWSVFIDYPRFLLHLRAQPFAGVIPQAMANFRGLTSSFFRSDQSSGAIAAISILSAAALIRTLTVWKQARLASPEAPGASLPQESDIAFALTVMFALLVSYHLNPHDLSLLLLPISLLLRGMLSRTPRLSGLRSWATALLLGTISLPPFQLWALRTDFYALISIPVGALFLTAASTAQPRSTGNHAPSA